MEAILRLRIVEDIKSIPEIKLSHQQLMLNSIPALMTRIHKCRRLRQLHLVASKIQGFFRGFRIRKKYLEIRQAALTI